MIQLWVSSGNNHTAVWGWWLDGDGLQCGLNVAFDSEVTRSCDKIKNIKLEATFWLWCDFAAMATVVVRPMRASLIQSAPQSNAEQTCVQICSKHRWSKSWVVNFFVCHLDIILLTGNILFLY